MECKILMFNSYEHLRYWFKIIYGFLIRTNPNIIFTVKANESIDYGNQRWIFGVSCFGHEDKSNYKLIGYNKNTLIFYDLEHDLEENFEKTMVRIVKGKDIKTELEFPEKPKLNLPEANELEISEANNLEAIKAINKRDEEIAELKRDLNYVLYRVLDAIHHNYFGHQDIDWNFTCIRKKWDLDGDNNDK